MRSETVVFVVTSAAAVVASTIDARTRRVPNSLTLTVATIGVALAAGHLSGVTVPQALAGFGVGLLLMLPGHVLGATGAGDVKLLAAVGTLLGPARVGRAFVYTALGGGMLAIAVAVRRGRLRQTLRRAGTLVRTRGSNVDEIEHESAGNRFAYAPAIAAGAVAAALGL